MIVDTSAIISILFDEDEADHFDEAIVNAPHCRRSVVSFLETVMVLEGRRGDPAGDQLGRIFGGGGYRAGAGDR